ncbi:hypothetical protein IWZ03DRAFT_366300 [Phyllosticta citriasiana]|uniref:Uncharacterized protein n=1 Tax=Phyllosticta citriasiana TaxID=595635 RepID=A0ABR1L366_9PEZI
MAAWARFRWAAVGNTLAASQLATGQIDHASLPRASDLEALLEGGGAGFEPAVCASAQPSVEVGGAVTAAKLSG